MTNESFMREMKLLFDTFGTSEYPPTRVKMIFESVADLPVESLRWIVVQFCKSKPIKYPPLPNEFDEAAHAQRKRLKEFEVQKTAEEVDRRGPEHLKEILEQFGASNVIEAMEKFKGGR